VVKAGEQAARVREAELRLKRAGDAPVALLLNQVKEENLETQEGNVCSIVKCTNLFHRNSDYESHQEHFIHRQFVSAFAADRRFFGLAYLASLRDGGGRPLRDDLQQCADRRAGVYVCLPAANPSPGGSPVRAKRGVLRVTEPGDGYPWAVITGLIFNLNIAFLYLLTFGYALVLVAENLSLRGGNYPFLTFQRIAVSLVVAVALLVMPNPMLFYLAWMAGILLLISGCLIRLFDFRSLTLSNFSLSANARFCANTGSISAALAAPRCWRWPATTCRPC
jgi:hypothetical protein